MVIDKEREEDESSEPTVAKETASPWVGGRRFLMIPRGIRSYSKELERKPVWIGDCERVVCFRDGGRSVSVFRHGVRTRQFGVILLQNLPNDAGQTPCELSHEFMLRKGITKLADGRHEPANFFIAIFGQLAKEGMSVFGHEVRPNADSCAFRYVPIIEVVFESVEEAEAGPGEGNRESMFLHNRRMSLKANIVRDLRTSI